MTDKIIAWWKSQNITSSDKLIKVLGNFQIVFAKDSSGIEGNSMTYMNARNVFEGKSLINFSGTAMDVVDILNQKRAFEFLMKSFDDKVPISVEFVKRLHKLMLRDCYDDERYSKGERPGSFKIRDYCVGVSEVGTPPEYVEEDLRDLLEEVNSSTTGNVLLKATYMHAVFETIHPFADGNGRVGRALANYYLLLNNHPPIVLFDEDKETYYMALEVFNRTDELSGFKKFMEEQLVKTWKNKVTDCVQNSLNVHMTSEGVAWCRKHAPACYKDLSDNEIWSLLKDLYLKYS